jgi:MoaA/NifB/PqqE/SkfB family radical SAM enzyme
MRFPLHITTDMIRHQVRNARLGNRRYPFVLMLEPLYTCNLACLGCAIERHTGKLKDRLPVELCLQAVEECGAPAVSICGGEPTVYPELLQPHKRLTVNIHLDGMRGTHDYVCAREGVFDKAIEMIKESKRRGFHVITNTTVFKETDIAEVEALCELLTGYGIDGMLISPGYQYESVDHDIFMTQEDMRSKFKRVLEISKKYRLTSTPMFLEFAAGLRDYKCSPWSTVTFTPNGWKGPCYLIGKKFTWSWEEFWNLTDWDYWESREDRLCQNCAMHSGFEASVVRELPRNPGDMVRLATWNLLG